MPLSHMPHLMQSLACRGAIAALGILVVVVPATATHAPRPALPTLSTEAIAARALPALVTVLVKDSRGELVKSGSGFFIEPKRIVTNMHVISGGGTISVVDLNKREFAVTSARLDEEHDLALLEAAEAVEVNALPLGNPETTAVGESVVAAGSPLGMQGTVSTGIVSARRIHKGVAVIQTTAPISQGSSGGPLINSRGEVIGVNSFMVADGQNLNFAQLSSHIAALRAGGGRGVDFSRGETVAAKSDPVDTNQDAILSLLAQPVFSGTAFKQSLIGEANLALLDTRTQRAYFSLRQDLQNGNDRARVDAAAGKFVADVSTVTLGSDDGMQSRFSGAVFRRSPEQWVFFSTDVANLRLRFDGMLKIKFKSAEFAISSGELKSYLTNASVRGGVLSVNTTHYASELGGQRSVVNWGALVARPGEPSLTRLVRDLTGTITETEKKIQRLVDFVGGEVDTDPAQATAIAKRASEVLMTRTGTVPQKAVLLASLLEQLPVDYILVYSGDQAWVAVPQGSFRTENFLSITFAARQWTLLDVSRPDFTIGQTKSPTAPGFNSLVLAQQPQRDGRIYHRTTGMPVGNR